jgi:hypothetical protein
MSYDEYLKNLGDYLSLHSLHYKKFSIDSAYYSAIKKIHPLKILVITEPWCSDSLALLPIIVKMAEINKNWELRVLLRDKNDEVMKKFLTDGLRAIPVFIFIDEEFNIIFKWGPRPKATAAIFDQYRSQIKSGEIEKKDVIKKIRMYYAKDRGRSSFLELMRELDKHLITELV